MAETELANLKDLGETDSTYIFQANVGERNITTAKRALSMHDSA